MPNCGGCGVKLTDDNWYQSQRERDMLWCIGCQKKQNDVSNSNRLYINGKYIPQSDPRYGIFKPGRYKTDGDIDLLGIAEEGCTRKEGYVYVIWNKAWPSWVKIGMAENLEKRVNSFQTSSPLRDFVLVHSVYSSDRASAEIQAHKKAKKLGEKRKEWFNITKEDATKILDSLNVSDIIKEEPKQVEVKSLDLFSYAERYA